MARNICSFLPRQDILTLFSMEECRGAHPKMDLKFCGDCGSRYRRIPFEQEPPEYWLLRHKLTAFTYMPDIVWNAEPTYPDFISQRFQDDIFGKEEVRCYLTEASATRVELVCPLCHGCRACGRLFPLHQRMQYGECKACSLCPVTDRSLWCNDCDPIDGKQHVRCNGKDRGVIYDHLSCTGIICLPSGQWMRGEEQMGRDRCFDCTSVFGGKRFCHTCAKIPDVGHQWWCGQ